MRTVLLALIVCAGCSNSAPQPPTVTPPSGTETVTGSERLGWDQRAGDAAELATIRYVVYVDNNRFELAGVSCAPTAGPSGYTCSARMPTMTPGVHTLEIAAFIQDSGLFESARSAPLHINVAGATNATSDATASAISINRAGAPSESKLANAARIAAGLQTPSDLALLPDGGVLIAERSGRIQVVRGGALIREPALVVPSDAGGAGAVLAIAVGPEFERTRFVYAIVTARNTASRLTFTIARFREAGDTFGDRVVLLDRVPASSDPHAAIRFGPDGKLYAAFDAGGDPRTVHDAASFNGKVLRLNPDGTTPRDQRSGSPVFSAGMESPRGLAWDRSSSLGQIWLADVNRVGSVRWPSPARSIAVFDNSMFVASDDGLTRVRFDGKTLAREEQIVDGVAVFAVAAAVDGRIYFATTDSLYLHVGKPALLR